MFLFILKSSIYLALWRVLDIYKRGTITLQNLASLAFAGNFMKNSSGVIYEATLSYAARHYHLRVLPELSFKFA